MARCKGCGKDDNRAQDDSYILCKDCQDSDEDR